MTKSRLLLDRFPFVHTRSLDEAVSLQSSINCPVWAEPRNLRKPFEWRANRIAAASLGITVGEYRAGVHARTENVTERYSLTFALKGSGQVTQHARAASLVPGRCGSLASPSLPADVLLESGYRGIQVVIPARVVESTLDALAGASRRAPLVFDLSVDFDRGSAAGMLRLLSFMLAEADRDQSVLKAPVVVAKLAEGFVCSLLLDLPHSHSRLLHQAARTVEPGHLRRAEEFMAANAHRPLTIVQIAAAAGIRAGTMFATFRAHRGCSPMGFLRARRYDLARSRLLASSAATVGEVALSCGFEHLGRFSVGYRRRFGESPKETLRRARSAL
jgi:AraC-like DNA-binding protein